ncbi:MAG: hypothetical protein WAP51_03770 [Candidatus Sungiibacteriota bacterium]
MAHRKKLPTEPGSQKNYGQTAERRVDQALRALVAQEKIHFGFRASQKLDAEGVDHVLGVLRPKFAVWVVQVTSGKKKRRTYYRRLSKAELALVKKPYRRRRYYRYIPLLAVTPKVRDAQIETKLLNISRHYSSVFENKRAPERLKVFLVAFLAAHEISVPRALAGNTP